MARTNRQSARIAWLDGLRGLAALQVVLQHYAYAFLPGLGFGNPGLIHFAWEARLIGTPFVLLIDGAAAVCLFFIMSGVVLTLAFQDRPLAVVPAITRRVVRLGLPIAAGLGLAAALFSLLPSAHLAAAGTLGRASWLGVAVPTPVSVPAVAHQIAAEALLTGYRDLSFLPQWITGIDLAPLEQSLDPPLWTMHIEFAGSLLVAALVALRASVGRATYVTTCLGLSVCFMASPLILFIVGHLAADRLGRGRRGICTQILGAALLLSGVLLCSASGALASSVLALPHLPPIGPALGPRDIQIVVGVLLIFFGLDSLPILCRCAETPPARWFGKISFSLYLTHYPILFTLTATIYTLLPPGWSDEARLAATGLTGIVISVLIASLFQRCIDRPAIDLSRRLPRFIAWRPPASTAIETVQ